MSFLLCLSQSVSAIWLLLCFVLFGSQFFFLFQKCFLFDFDGGGGGCGGDI